MVGNREIGKHLDGSDWDGDPNLEDFSADSAVNQQHEYELALEKAFKRSSQIIGQKPDGTPWPGDPLAQCGHEERGEQIPTIVIDLRHDAI